MYNIALEISTPLSQQTGRRLHGAPLGLVLTALMLTVLLEALDQTVVGTALPKIIGTLQGFDRYTKLSPPTRWPQPRSSPLSASFQTSLGASGSC